MRRNSTSPEAYRADVDGPQREILERIRALIFEIAPDVVEGIAYGMLDYPGIANLAAQKYYVALYVAPAVLAKRKKDFPDVDSGKSCLRFRRLEHVDRNAMLTLLRDVRTYRESDIASK
jgi:hypothetical protein